MIFYRVPDDVTDTTKLWVAAIRAVKSCGLYQRAPTLLFIGNVDAPEMGQAWADMEAAEELLAELDDELALIHVAADAGGAVRFSVDFSQGINILLPDTQAASDVARFLALDAVVNARRGQSDRVARDLVAIFALSDALKFEPCLIS